MLDRLYSLHTAFELTTLNLLNTRHKSGKWRYSAVDDSPPSSSSPYHYHTSHRRHYRRHRRRHYRRRHQQQHQYLIGWCISTHCVFVSLRVSVVCMSAHLSLFWWSLPASFRYFSLATSLPLAEDRQESTQLGSLNLTSNATHTMAAAVFAVAFAGPGLLAGKWDTRKITELTQHVTFLARRLFAHLFRATMTIKAAAAGCSILS